MVFNTPHDMNQITRTSDTQEHQADHDPFICEDDAEWWLRKRFGIPVWGAQRLLLQADYRPAPARFRRAAFDMELVPDGWVEAEVVEAARRFMSECKPESGKLWRHPINPRRFRLRPPADLVFEDDVSRSPNLGA